MTEERGETKNEIRIRHERIGQSFLKRTRAYGKLILFGEHFVVYKVPALVGAVSAYTDCDVELTQNQPGLTVIDNRPAIPGYKKKKKDESDVAIQNVLKHLKFDTDIHGMNITFGGDLCAVSGIGSSAAQVVSLARGLGLTASLQLSDDEINAAGYEGEKGYHGTPSGIDNTASTYGGLLKFQRTDGDPIFTKKKITNPIRIVYASTGITASTTQVVGDVRSLKEANPEWFEGLMERYLKIIAQGEAAIDAGDMGLLGKMMDENHVLCQELTITCKESEDLVVAARKAGALGAKMTGTGRGGLVIALTPTVEIQESVEKALKDLAPQVWKTSFA